MKLGVLFSGGKDSCYAAYLAKKKGNEISCLISIFSKNRDSWMFHTPSINCVKKQASVMKIPIIIEETKGKKEKELKDLERAVRKAKIKFGIKGIVTGALASNYQASRIKKICDKLQLKSINPLWGKNQISLLRELIRNKFEIIITGVSAYPLNEKWLGRKIDNKFIDDAFELEKLYKVNPAGEGGEFESLVLNCPLFFKRLEFKGGRIEGDGNSYRLEAKVE
jgi:asparagine synthase (glutamine-hydrolysing)